MKGALESVEPVGSEPVKCSGAPERAFKTVPLGANERVCGISHRLSSLGPSVPAHQQAHGLLRLQPALQHRHHGLRDGHVHPQLLGA